MRIFEIGIQNSAAASLKSNSSSVLNSTKQKKKSIFKFSAQGARTKWSQIYSPLRGKGSHSPYVLPPSLPSIASIDSCYPLQPCYHYQLENNHKKLPEVIVPAKKLQLLRWLSLLQFQ